MNLFRGDNETPRSSSSPGEPEQSHLSPYQRHLLNGAGTEAPFSGEFVEHYEDGAYHCVSCGVPLFASETKFESTTPGLIGWPAFWATMDDACIELRADHSCGMRRIEILCKNCGGHLGHYFDDEAAPNGKHYCVNSACLAFRPAPN